MARSYKRDARGRFASGGGGGSGGRSGGTRKAAALPKTTSARGRAKTRETAARAAVKAGGGTKAARSLLTAQRARDFYKATGTGTKRSKTKPRSGIRATGGLPRPQAANSIKPLRRRERGLAPAGLKANAIRSYSPRTIRGRNDEWMRQTMRKARGPKPEHRIGLPPSKLTLPELNLKIARTTAREIADRNRRDVKGQVARFMLKEGRTDQDIKNARTLITRRAKRAAAAAARGSKPAAKAAAIYDRQLAPVLPKGKGKGKNNLRPGPRNTKGAPKKKRRPRKPKG